MKEKLFCRTCKGLRNHKELFQKKTRGEEDFDFFQWIDNYFIIECLGCETISFLKVYGDTTMVEHDEEGNTDYYFENQIFPKYLEKSFEIEQLGYLPMAIRDIYTETITALKCNSYILTAGGLRAIIEAVCNYLKIKKGNLEERIDLLHNNGHLTLSESNRLHSIRFLGNDALHEIEKPKKDQLYILLDIINHLLNNLFINDKLVKGSVATIIDNYDTFLQLIKSKITNEMLNNEFTINQLLGDSKRLIGKKHFSPFEERFIIEVSDDMYDFISIIRFESKVTFRIQKQPDSFFNW